MTRRALLEARAMHETDQRTRLRLYSRRTDYTARNKAMLEGGHHPATGSKLRPDLGTCGDCVFHVERHMGGRYHKCKNHRLGLSGSEASDIRVGWPACDFFEREPA